MNTLNLYLCDFTSQNMCVCEWLSSTIFAMLRMRVRMTRRSSTPSPSESSKVDSNSAFRAGLRS